MKNSPTRVAAAVSALILMLNVAACSRPAPNGFTVLAMNDLYRIEGLVDSNEGGLARVRTIRRELEDSSEVLVLHAGDFLFPSFLSRRYGGRQMIDVMKRLDGRPRRFDDRMIVVFGNHEFDRRDPDDAHSLDQRIETSDFWWLPGNIAFKDSVTAEPGDSVAAYEGVEATNLLPSYRRNIGGIEVGVFGLVLNLGDVSYVEQASWSVEERVEIARDMTARLRESGAEFVIALTHQTIDADRSVLALGSAGPDLVVGGHEHGRIREERDGRLVVKADADGKSVATFRISRADDGALTVDQHFVDLDASVTPDPRVAEVVDRWLTRHATAYCEDLGFGPECLEDELAVTDVYLAGEELRVRSEESSIGGWVAGRIAGAFAPDSVDAAVVNAGALRLNQDLPAEAVFRRRHLEELIQYDDDLLLIDLSGADLTAALRHSASCVGGGPWLQTHGITFAFDPNDRTIDRIQIGGEPIRPSSTYRVALPSFIAGGGDRYTWFANAPRVARHPVSLKAVLLEAMPGPGAPLGAPPVGAIELADLDLPAPEPCPVD